VAIVRLEGPSRVAAVRFAEQIVSETVLASLNPLLSGERECNVCLVSARPINSQDVGMEFRYGGLLNRSQRSAATVEIDAELASWIQEHLVQHTGSHVARAFVAQNLLAKASDPVVDRWVHVKIVGDAVFFVARQPADVLAVIRQASSAWQFLGVIMGMSDRSVHALIVEAFDGEAFLIIEPEPAIALLTAVSNAWPIDAP
jgi:hypothetical protein